MQRYNIPGATVVITRDGHVVYTHAFGSSDLATGAAARDDTHYEIGSITKQFTAAAILQLHEAGKVDIDAKVAVYVPSAPHANEITVRELLTQTSGLADYLDVSGVDTSKTATYDQLMASVAGKPLQFAPGSAWRYSNTNYVILGRIIESVSNEPYDTYVKRHILKPLGMTETFTIGDEASIPGMAFGYQLVDGHLSPVRAAISQSYAWSAGDMVSTVGDVEKWSSALQNGRVVSPQDYALMMTSQPTTQGDSGYGFGLFLDSVRRSTANRAHRWRPRLHCGERVFPQTERSHHRTDERWKRKRSSRSRRDFDERCLRSSSPRDCGHGAAAGTGRGCRCHRPRRAVLCEYAVGPRRVFDISAALGGEIQDPVFRALHVRVCSVWYADGLRLSREANGRGKAMVRLRRAFRTGGHVENRHRLRRGG